MRRKRRADENHGWFRFDAAARLLDPATEDLRATAYGGYSLLVARAWLQPDQCTLPHDDAQLQKWARMTPRRMARKPITNPALLHGDEERLCCRVFADRSE